MTSSGDQIRAVYVISVAAELAGMHPQTLRIYERKGLLAPARTEGGSRRYSELDIHRLQRIQELTASGLNLEGVRRVIALEEQVAELQGEVYMLRAAMHEAALVVGELPPRVSISRTVVKWPTSDAKKRSSDKSGDK
jgi:MerR family transcriptional regulator/heat shock protein HspR